MFLPSVRFKRKYKEECKVPQTYRRSSFPVFVCIRASTRIRKLKQNQDFEFEAAETAWMGGGWTGCVHGGGVMRLGQVCDAALGKAPQLSLPFFFFFFFTHTFCFIYCGAN